MAEFVIASLQSFRISRATARDRDIFYKRQEPCPVPTGGGGKNRYLQDIMPRTKIE